MPLIEIKTWTDGRVLYAGKHGTLKEAVEAAVKARANLRDADLTDADLRRADLTDADLRGADLTDADLRGADLTDADLRRADLSKIHLAYQSHDLLAEILRRAADNDTEKLKIAGYILVCREKCWEDFAKLAAVDPLGDWALNELAKWVQPDDGAPRILRVRAEKLAANQSNQEAARP